MMMKALPGASFEVIQAQIILGTLKVLFNMPARTTQLQAKRLGRRSVKVGQIIMIRLWIARGPVHHQPDTFQIPLSLTQPVLEKHGLPSQPGPASFSIGRLPRTGLPLAGSQARRQFSQGLSRG